MRKKLLYLAKTTCLKASAMYFLQASVGTEGDRSGTRLNDSVAVAVGHRTIIETPQSSSAKSREAFVKRKMLMLHKEKSGR